NVTCRPMCGRYTHKLTWAEVFGLHHLQADVTKPIPAGRAGELFVCKRKSCNRSRARGGTPGDTTNSMMAGKDHSSIQLLRKAIRTAGVVSGIMKAIDTWHSK